MLPLILIVAAAWAYSSSFSGVLIGDDDAGIAQNVSIRSISTALSPPVDVAKAGEILGIKLLDHVIIG